MGPKPLGLFRRTLATLAITARSFAIDVTESKAVPAYCLSIHAHYRCAHTGECCTTGWPIPAERPLVDLLMHTGLGAGLTADQVFDEQRGPDGTVRMLRTTDGHRCVFHDPDRSRCSVHGQAGEAALPTACRNFPRVTLRDRRGVFITLSHFCPTAAALLLEDQPIAIVEAPPPLSLDGAVEGLDATDVLPPLVGPEMLADADGYTAWEAAAIATLDDRRYDAREALQIIAAATDDIRAWRPGDTTLAARVAEAFHRARTAADPPSAVAPPVDRAVKRFLAAHLFASWSAYQDGGLAGVVRAVDYAHATVIRELLERRSLGEGGRAPFLAAVRAADFHLRHSRTDVRPRPLPSLRVY
jgi:hypothetical protein